MCSPRYFSRPRSFTACHSFHFSGVSLCHWGTHPNSFRYSVCAQFLLTPPHPGASAQGIRGFHWPTTAAATGALSFIMSCLRVNLAAAREEYLCSLWSPALTTVNYQLACNTATGLQHCLEPLHGPLPAMSLLSPTLTVTMCGNGDRPLYHRAETESRCGEVYVGP